MKQAYEAFNEVRKLAREVLTLSPMAISSRLNQIRDLLQEGLFQGSEPKKFHLKVEFSTFKQKVRLIRLIREWTACSLKEAKENAEKKEGFTFEGTEELVAQFRSELEQLGVEFSLQGEDLYMVRRLEPYSNVWVDCLSEPVTRGKAMEELNKRIHNSPEYESFEMVRAGVRIVKE